MPRTIHILNQFVWPDSAPTALYAEQLASALQEDGWKVALVGGSGTYRPSSRPKPQTPLSVLEHPAGRRGRLSSELAEYHTVTRLFEHYLRDRLHPGDLVIATSAPPLTLWLHRTIRQARAISVYWLQDYFPDLLRAVAPAPFLWSAPLRTYWDYHLSQWDHVVRIGGNLGYAGPNARIIRNWATLRFPKDAPVPDAGTALYTGNLSHGHDPGAFLALCDELHREGMRVQFRGDGIWAARLPSWIESGPPFQTEEELADACMRAGTHLVAAHPKLRHALFPSKIWNSLALGRNIRTSGFSGPMAEELSVALNTNPYQGIDDWKSWIRHRLGPELTP